MLRELFGRRSQRPLDDLIFDVAEHQRAADLDEFLARMQAHVFYMPLTTAIATPPGTRITVGGDVRTPYVEMQGMKLLMFFTGREHPNLGPNFAGIDGLETLRMTLASPDADGALFHNAGNSWIGIDKQKCQHVLG